mgnify:CR=1 FL=1
MKEKFQIHVIVFVLEEVSLKFVRTGGKQG